MEIINELEPSAREVYCGSIGWVAPDGSSYFNVAIRTLLLYQDNEVVLNVGGEIVHDSTASAEYEEALWKARFAIMHQTDLLVIETLRWPHKDGFVRLDGHLARMETTCAKFGISVDKTDMLSRLAAAVHGSAQRVRLTVGLNGEIKVTSVEIAKTPACWKVMVSEEKTSSGNPWLSIKTNQRAFYDTARKNLPVGIDEMIFINERGEITEGTITNVFVDFGEGLVTPALSCGVLPGILRLEMLEQSICREATILAKDFARAKTLYIGNSLRGLIRAVLV